MKGVQGVIETSSSAYSSFQAFVLISVDCYLLISNQENREFSGFLPTCGLLLKIGWISRGPMKTPRKSQKPRQFSW